MNRWFRLYDEMLDDPKAQRLPPQDFKIWINLLCLASRNDGKLPCISDIAFALRIAENDAVTVIERLHIGGLIDKRNGGTDGFRYSPHGWEKRQYKSDNSADRVKKHREKRNGDCNVSCNVTETPPETDTEADTETDISMSKTPVSDASQKFDPKDVVEVWNDTATKLGKPIVRDLTPERRQLLKARMSQYALEDFVSVFNNIEQSPFLRGDTGWRGCTFDWVFKKANFQKILEGNYNG
jgi:DNA-binding MarR family transcriptional regulator